MASVEILVKKLSEVQDLLVELPDDAFGERERLIRLRAELQTQADAHAAGADLRRPAEDLRSEMAALQQRIVTAPKGERIRLETRISRIKAILQQRRPIPG